jgi:hypothetical protein
MEYFLLGMIILILLIIFYLNNEDNKNNKRELQLKEHILSLTDGKDYGLCSPPMEAQVAMKELCRYFLGENWYVVMPLSQEQINTEIVYEIERRYKGYKIKNKRS